MSIIAVQAILEKGFVVHRFYFVGLGSDSLSKSMFQSELGRWQ